MKNKDEQLIYHINKHYNELISELNLISDFKDFVSNLIVKKAIILDLIQIGEKVNRLSDEFKAKLNKINIKGIIGFRNYLVHGYGTKGNNIIWNTLKNDLPNFIKEINNVKK